MNAARATLPPPPGAGSVKFILSVTTGPDAGAVFQLLPPRASIGRGPSNDISLSDPRCSRSHAIIEIGAAGILARDVSERANLLINGINVAEGPLRDGDVMRIGETDLRFRVKRPSAGAGAAHGLAEAGRGGQGTGQPGGGSPGYRMGPADRQRPRPASSSKLPFYGIVAVIAIALAWLLSSSPKEIAKDDRPKNMQAEIDLANKAVESLRAKRDMKPEERERFLEADRHYREGFRDLQSGLYDRAAKSFETALAIDPRHELATFYRKRAFDRRDEMIAGWIDEGRRFRDNKMYARCSASMEKAIKAIASPQDPRLKETQALREECEAQNEAR
jgi:hypothetical protein